jgi:hypothetical protein
MRYYGFRQLITEPTHRFGSLPDHMYINFDLPGDITPIVTPVHFSQHSVVIYLTTYSFHGHQKFTNSCN